MLSRCRQDRAVWFKALAPFRSLASIVWAVMMSLPKLFETGTGRFVKSLLIYTTIIENTYNAC
jgi:hypothetical protein